MATLKKQGKTGRRKGATKAACPKDRQPEGAQAEEESAASDETEVVDDDDDDDESVGNILRVPLKRNSTRG